MGQRDLPPLAAVRVFEAAARHLSFTRAAEELGMTQAAVSYQIKVLEERVGSPLFLRLTRALELTQAGRSLAPAASEALELIASAFATARASTRGVLSISVVPTVAAHWLAPRIGSFQLRHPDVAVRIDATRQLADFTRDDVDVAIRSDSDGDWPGLLAHRLMPIDFTPMLSPKLADRLGMPKAPADLLKFPIIDPDDPWWLTWFAAYGIADYDPGSRPIVRMGDQHLEARAAIGGQGVAILTPAFYSTELESGLLVQPFGAALEGRSYWLCYAEARRNVPKIRAFREWMLAELETPAV